MFLLEYWFIAKNLILYPSLETLQPILPHWVHWLEKTNDLLEYWSQKNSVKFGFQAYWSIASPRFHLRTWKKEVQSHIRYKVTKNKVLAFYFGCKMWKINPSRKLIFPPDYIQNFREKVSKTPPFEIITEGPHIIVEIA